MRPPEKCKGMNTRYFQYMYGTRLAAGGVRYKTASVSLVSPLSLIVSVQMRFSVLSSLCAYMKNVSTLPSDENSY